MDAREKILQAFSLSEKPMTVKELSDQIRIERHTLSKYLGNLEREGIIARHRIGRSSLWYLDPSPIKSIFGSDSEYRSVAETILTNLVRSLPVGLIICDTDMNIQFLNKVLVDTYGQNIVGEHVSEILEDTDSLLAALSSERPYQTMLKSGEKIYAVQASTITNPNETKAHILILDDVTAMKHSEELARKNELYYKTLVSISPDGIIVVSMDNMITLANRQALEFFGVEKERDIIGTHLIDYVSEKDREYFAEARKNLLKVGKREKIPYNITNKKGKSVWGEVTSSLLRDASGKPEGVVKIIRDVTEKYK